MGTHAKTRGADSTIGHAKSLRRRGLLEACAAFLRSTCAKSDRIIRQCPQMRRAQVAQEEYDLATDLACRIEKELALDDARPCEPPQALHPAPVRRRVHPGN